MPLLSRGRPPRWWVALLLLSAALLRAAEPDSAWSVRVWKTDDGLAGNNVTGVAEGPDGFLWIVAGARLARFDGAQLEDATSAGALGPERRLRTVHRLRNGDLAVLTFEGEVLRAGQGRITELPFEPPAARGDDLAEAEDGSLLVTYQNGTVHRWQDNRLQSLGADDGLPPGRSRCYFITDRQGRLWFAKGGTVGLYRDGRFETLQRFSEPIVRLAAAREGGVWICAHLRLLRLREDGALQEIGRVPAANPGAQPTALLEDRTGAVWIGTTISGLFRQAGARFENVPISHREVNTLNEDREGNLWAGTSGGGLNEVLPRAITIEGEATGLPFRAMQAICEAPDGRLWAVAQDGSVVKRADGTWHNAFAPGDGFEGEASCIAADARGGIWIGTRNQRLYCWRDGRLDSWGPEHGLGALVRTIVVAQSGDVWVGSSRPGGLHRLRDGQVRSFPVPERCESVWAIAEDAAGRIWAGGTASTLLRIGADDSVADESGLTGSLPFSIRSLHATSEGALWICYDQAGLARLKDGNFRRITTKEGLSNDNLRLAISDRHGAMWFAAIASVFKVRQEELDAVADGRAARVQPVLYGRDQGIHAILGGTIGALLSRDGRLWLPLATSLAVIHPDRQPQRREPPPVLVTRVTVDDRAVASYGGTLPAPAGVELKDAMLRFEPGHRRIGFDFTALSFSVPRDVRFRYRLENLDDRWIEGGTQRSASYSRLRAGAYRFQVRASSVDGAWPEAGASVAFTVTPFLWETWWFRVGAAAAFSGVVYALARLAATRRVQARLRTLEQQTALERERARIARDIHDDLGSRLTKIALLGGLAERERTDPGRVGERVREISATARQLLKALDETVWAVNPRNDHLPHLINYLGQFAAKFLATAEIACVLELPDDPPARPVTAEARHNLFLAVKEALTNVVRHACARTVRFGCKIDAHTLRIEIADDGLGNAPAADTPDADGLRNMQQRMTLIGGQFAIQSSPGTGTRVTLVMPLARGPGPGG